MSHHGKDERPIPDIFRQIFPGRQPPHPDPLHEAARQTRGEFPHGRLNAQDEGMIPMEIGHHAGKVIMRFPEPVTWLGLTPEGAIGLAQCLIETARKAGCKIPVTLKL